MVISAEDLSFVLCVENGVLEGQALMLCESIRQFGGRYKDCPVVAVCPRPVRAPSAATQRRLRELGVVYRSLLLNKTVSPYGPINRVVAGAWAERSLNTEFIIVLDSDMAFLSEPTFVVADAGVRPVDVQGTASSGDTDPRDAYWKKICGLAGIDIGALPMLEASVTRERIRASYNGGFTIVRRKAAILQRTAEIFLASYSAGYKSNPAAGRRPIRASTGLVGSEASQWWGSSQAALAAAIWSSTQDVHVYGAQYNIPIHILARQGLFAHWPDMAGPPILVHYHSLQGQESAAALAAVLDRLGCAAENRDWMLQRSRMIDTGTTHTAAESPMPG